MLGRGGDRRQWRGATVALEPAGRGDLNLGRRIAARVRRRERAARDVAGADEHEPPGPPDRGDQAPAPQPPGNGELLCGGDPLGSCASKQRTRQSEQLAYCRRRIVERERIAPLAPLDYVQGLSRHLPHRAGHQRRVASIGLQVGPQPAEVVQPVARVDPGPVRARKCRALLDQHLVEVVRKIDP